MWSLILFSHFAIGIETIPDENADLAGVARSVGVDLATTNKTLMYGRIPTARNGRKNRTPKLGAEYKRAVDEFIVHAAEIKAKWVWATWTSWDCLLLNRSEERLMGEEEEEELVKPVNNNNINGAGHTTKYQERWRHHPETFSPLRKRFSLSSLRLVRFPSILWYRFSFFYVSFPCHPLLPSLRLSDSHLSINLWPRRALWPASSASLFFLSFFFFSLSSSYHISYFTPTGRRIFAASVANIVKFPPYPWHLSLSAFYNRSTCRKKKFLACCGVCLYTNQGRSVWGGGRVGSVSLVKGKVD